MTEDVPDEVRRAVEETEAVRLTGVLRRLGVAMSTWYRRGVAEGERKGRGPSPRPVAPEIREAVVTMAREDPWYGYKRIAVMCRRCGVGVKNREAYQVMREEGLLQKRRSRKAEVYQAAKLYELLPKKPNELWQMDVTYVHIPGYGWHYAVTVIDYYSRYLLACYLTTSYSAVECTYALKLARAESERIHGALEKQPFLVTDNGPSFMAKRFWEHLQDRYTHVRIQYRTPTQLGLLERFHQTLKQEEIYWRLYDNPADARRCLEEFRHRYNERRPHWALVPAAGGDPHVPAEVYANNELIMIPKWQGWAKGVKEKLEQLMEVAA